MGLAWPGLVKAILNSAVFFMVQTNSFFNDVIHVSMKYAHEYLENPREQGTDVKIPTDFNGFKMASVALHQALRELLLVNICRKSKKC